MANLLLHESSPYLLQHAHNPVNWLAWNETTLALAKSQNKLMLISIGYSACHWCHVMERQCFENKEIAQLMNKYFICVKVDREERPDIDALYLQAVQLMNGQGGWPLNCFTLPDGRPVYGGTYFPPEQWIAILENLQHLFETNVSKMEEYAQKLAQGLTQSQIYSPKENKTTDLKYLLQKCLEKWKKSFDHEYGGSLQVPKFPMPVNYLFLLLYAHNHKEHDVLQHVYLSLVKMSQGGIFDQVGGGFARYSTDGKWKVPHFEKMLYDNAQLISLYSKAFLIQQNETLKETIEGCISFINYKMKGAKGEFFSALDADSEGIEGLYYIWKKDELQRLITHNYALFTDYYSIHNEGYWEHNAYILWRTQTDEAFCNKHQISAHDLKSLKQNWQKTLLTQRNKRIPPALDDKALCSWNAMMIEAYVNAWLALQNKDYLTIATACAQFLVSHMESNNNSLYHVYRNEKAHVNGFLEDYAFTSKAFIELYAATGVEYWLICAQKYVEYAIANFYDQSDGLFYLNSHADDALVARQKEIYDNVIPAANSVMAHVLFSLSIYFEDEKYSQMAQRMAALFYSEIEQFGSAFANWAHWVLKFNEPIYHIALPLKDFEQNVALIAQANKINTFTFALNNSSVLPFINDNKQGSKFYLCVNHVCKLPFNNMHQLLTALSYE